MSELGNHVKARHVNGEVFVRLTDVTAAMRSYADHCDAEADRADNRDVVLCSVAAATAVRREADWLDVAGTEFVSRTESQR